MTAAGFMQPRGGEIPLCQIRYERVEDQTSTGSGCSAFASAKMTCLQVGHSICSPFALVDFESMNFDPQCGQGCGTGRFQTAYLQSGYFEQE